MIGLAAQSTWCFAASFDCRKAATAVEKLVCSSNELRVLDVRLYEAYQRAQRLASDIGLIRTEQRRWLKESRNRCNTVSCLMQVYETRVSQLDSGITYEECKDGRDDSLSLGYCIGRQKDETESAISDLISVLSVRFSAQEMKKFMQIQSEWRENIRCSCFEQVGWGSGPGHSLSIIACEKNEADRRLSEIREIVAGEKGLEYGGTGPRSCAAIRQTEEADPEHQMFEAIRKN